MCLATQSVGLSRISASSPVSTNPPSGVIHQSKGDDGRADKIPGGMACWRRWADIPKMITMLIEERPADDDALSGLVSAAFEELVAKYGAEGRSGVHPEARFLVAVTGDRAVGCGAVQPVDS